MRRLRVALEGTKENSFAVVVEMFGESALNYPVSSREQGEDVIANCLNVMMPIVTKAMLNGEYVSMVINKRESEKDKSLLSKVDGRIDSETNGTGRHG